jgi:hypothetical protein
VENNVNILTKADKNLSLIKVNLGRLLSEKVVPNASKYCQNPYFVKFIRIFSVKKVAPKTAATDKNFQKETIAQTANTSPIWSP